MKKTILMLVAAMIVLCGCGKKEPSGGQSGGGVSNRDVVIQRIHETLKNMDMPKDWQDNLINGGGWKSKEDEEAALAILMSDDNKVFRDKYFELKGELLK